MRSFTSRVKTALILFRLCSFQFTTQALDRPISTFDANHDSFTTFQCVTKRSNQIVHTFLIFRISHSLMFIIPTIFPPPQTRPQMINLTDNTKSDILLINTIYIPVNHQPWQRLAISKLTTTTPIGPPPAGI